MFNSETPNASQNCRRVCKNAWPMAGSKRTNLSLEEELEKKGYVLSSVLGEGSYGKVGMGEGR